MSLLPPEEFYSGFYISESVGNNAFSYAVRKNKKIYVPPLIAAGPETLQLGKETVFSEIEDGQEKNAAGLAQFLHFEWNKKEVFIFDNHNHAFFFWQWGVRSKKFAAGKRLIHVDQHKDTREPPLSLSASTWQEVSLESGFEYTNKVLNVGNFILPAQRLGIFSEFEIVYGEEDFGKEFAAPFVLDLDLDIFAPSMEYIDRRWKMSSIRQWLSQASFVTVATSPFFMDQTTAIKIVAEIFLE